MAFVDLRLRETSGLELLPRLLAESPHLAVVILTAYATFDTAVEAIKRGAVDYLSKPFVPDQIRHLVAKVAEQRATQWRLAELDQQLKQAIPEIDLATQSPAMRATLDVVRRAAGAEAPVLLRGENGTGKGVLARTLHVQSRRAARPFVVVNCPTLSEDLLTSELFGHARGAFTGAVTIQAGRVEVAEGGTLFLDEIAEISPGLQSKLLRFAQDKEFERLGENQTRQADVRLVAATNRDLEADVAEGRFREDLFYRLNVIEVRVPPLRERTDDLLPLAQRFLEFFARCGGTGHSGIVPDHCRDSAQLFLAGQRPRTSQHNRARRHSVAGSGDRPAGLAGTHAGPKPQSRFAPHWRRFVVRGTGATTYPRGAGAHGVAGRSVAHPGHRLFNAMAKT